MKFDGEIFFKICECKFELNYINEYPMDTIYHDYFVTFNKEKMLITFCFNLKTKEFSFLIKNKIDYYGKYGKPTKQNKDIIKELVNIWRNNFIRIITRTDENVWDSMKLRSESIRDQVSHPIDYCEDSDCFTKYAKLKDKVEQIIGRSIVDLEYNPYEEL